MAQRNTQPRHTRGDRRGGQWRPAPRPEDAPEQDDLAVANYSSSRHPPPKSAYVPPEGTSAVVKVGRHQRTIKFKNGEWDHESLFGHQVLRSLQPEIDTSADGATETITGVVGQMLADGDITADPHLLRRCVSSCLSTRAFGTPRDWPMPQSMLRSDMYKGHCSYPAEIAARACMASMASDIIALAGDKDTRSAMFSGVEAAFSGTKFTDFLSHLSESWNGTDGHMMQRAVQRPIAGTTLMERWETLSDKSGSVAVAPVLFYLLSTCPPGDPLAQRALSLIGQFEGLRADLEAKDAYCGHVDVSHIYRDVIGVALHGPADAPREKARNVLRALTTPRDSVTSKRLMEQLRDRKFSFAETDQLMRDVWADDAPST